MNLTITPKIIVNSFNGNNLPVTNKSKQKDTNPITRTGEVMNLTKATYVAGLGLGAKLLFDLFDGDFLFEYAGKAASKMVDKNQQIVNPTRKMLCKAGGTIGLIAAALGLFAIAYTLYKSPNIAYESKINTFEKKNNMDIFMKSNQAQKGIYEQMNTEAQNANDAEKEKLKELYMKMQMTQK